MSIFKPNCNIETTDKSLVLEENKRKCIFSNPENLKLIKIIVDGCQITEGTKCDFLAPMRQHKLWLCALLVLLLAALGAFGAAAETTVGMSGAGSFTQLMPVTRSARPNHRAMNCTSKVSCTSFSLF